MRTLRGLLALGNGHIGEAIHSWSIPAVATCPGATEACLGDCYATKNFFLIPGVKATMAWRLRQSRRDDFARRMTREVKRKGCLVVRIHVSGDFYSPEYVRKWVEVAENCPATTFYFYTRSWRVGYIEVALRELAALANVVGWYSTDRDTGPVASLPPGVRVAFMNTEEGEEAEWADLVFRVRRLRGTPRVGLPVVCPKNAGKTVETNCGVCQKCWSQPEE